MKAYPYSRPLRRKSEFMAWQQAIDKLALQICPTEEWDQHMRRVYQVDWLVQHSPGVRNIKIFPVWKKYRKEALQVATLYQTLPILQHIPLRWACFLGKWLID